MVVEKWDQDIKVVETMHKYNIISMDIYAARLEDREPVSRHPASGIGSSLLASWMELSLAVEEKQ